MDDLGLDISEDLQNNLNFKDVDDIDEPKIAHPPAVGAYSDLKFEDDDDDLPAFKHGQDLPEYACAYCGIHDPASVVIIKNFCRFSFKCLPCSELSKKIMENIQKRKLWIVIIWFHEFFYTIKLFWSIVGLMFGVSVFDHVNTY